MSRILLLSDTGETVITVLGLLPHTLTIAPLVPQSLAENSNVDLVLVDGVTNLVAAKSMAGVLAAAQLPFPVLIVVAETSLSALDGSWGVSDFLLPTASIAEIDARIRVALSRHGGGSTPGLSHSGRFASNKTTKVTEIFLFFYYYLFKLTCYYTGEKVRVSAIIV